MSAPRLSQLGETAARYAQRGWPVLPLHTPISRGCSCHQSACQSIGKHPRTRQGLRDATTDLDRVTGWWQRWPHANIGIATGQASGLVVIDIDPDHGGETTLRRLHRVHPPPRTAQAGSGTGRHLYYASDEAVPSSIGRLGDGIDVRANGGYIVAPGSRHASGRRYRWIISTAIAPLPEPLAARMTELTQARTAPDRARSITDATTYGQAALEAETRAVVNAPTGQRNRTLNRAAFKLGQLAATQALTEQIITEQLSTAAAHCGLPHPEARRTITSGLRAGIRTPRDQSPMPAIEPLDL